MKQSLASKKNKLDGNLKSLFLQHNLLYVKTYTGMPYLLLTLYIDFLYLNLQLNNSCQFNYVVVRRCTVELKAEDLNIKKGNF